MSIRAQVAHQTEGRIRLQLPERGNRALVDHVSQLIAQTGLVRSVRANPVTGSIVIEFDGKREELLAKLSASVPIEILPAPVEQQMLAPLAAAVRPFKLVSGRQINPMIMAGTLFSAVGVVQAYRGQVLLPALSAFWYALNAFRMARMPAQGSAPD